MFHDSFAYRTPSFHLRWNKEKTLLYWRINTSIYINYVRVILMIWRIQSYFFVLINVSCYWCCCLVAKSCPTLLWPHGLQPARLLSPWDFLGKNTGMDCHFLLQGTFLTQGLNCVSCVTCIGRRVLYHCTTSEAQHKG